MKEYTGLTNAEVLDMLRRHTLVIYGAGYVAKYFFAALEDRGIANHVRDVMVTQLQSPILFHGFHVKELFNMRFSEDDLVCLAVHESNYEDLRKNILGKANFLWVTPYCQGTNFCDPLRKGIRLPINEVVRTNIIDRYNIAIRCLVIDELQGKNDIGKNIYKKHICKFSSIATAEKRLQRFCKIIHYWMKYGYENGHPIWLDEQNHILDGEHRTALCLYFGEKDIFADVYPSTSFYERFLKGYDAINHRVLSDGTFTKPEVKAIVDMQKRIENKINA